MSSKWFQVAIGVGASIGLPAVEARAQDATASIIPAEDTFTRQAAPNATFGTSGAIHVSGAESTNAAGIVQGVADGWLKFDTTSAVSVIDGVLGVGRWEIVSAMLVLDEVAAPPHALFTRGVGDFEVFWIPHDAWSEGIGRPNAVGTDEDGALSFAASESLRDAAPADSLGVFASTGRNGSIEVDLGHTEAFADDIAAGGDVTLLLAATDPATGFTFHSNAWKKPEERVSLVVTARTIGGVAPVVEDDGAATPPVGMCGTGSSMATLASLAMLSFVRLRGMTVMSRRGV